MSTLPPKADMLTGGIDVRLVPEADMSVVCARSRELPKLAQRF